MSNLRNRNVPCHFTGHITCRKCDVIMSHVKNKEKGVPLVLQVMSLSSVWHGYFKKWLCHCGDFRGQWTCTVRHLGHRREGGDLKGPDGAEVLRVVFKMLKRRPKSL